MSGRMRTVLWVLGGLAVLWALFWLFAFASMGMGDGGMMGGGGVMGGGTMGDGAMMQNGAAPEEMIGEVGVPAGAMIGGMVAQTLAMLGLIGVFVYLVVDSVRNRP